MFYKELTGHIRLRTLIYIRDWIEHLLSEIEAGSGQQPHVGWSHFHYILLLHNYSFCILRHFSPLGSDNFVYHEEERTREAFGEKTCSYLVPKCWEKRNLRVRWSKLPVPVITTLNTQTSFSFRIYSEYGNTAKGPNEFGNE